MCIRDRYTVFFFLMVRRPPRSPQSRSSAASDVYKRQGEIQTNEEYTALQIDLEKKTLDEKLAIMGLEPHEREKLQVKMLEAQIKFNEECKKQDEKTEKERQKASDKIAKERLSVRQKQLRIELEEAASYHYRNHVSYTHLTMPTIYSVSI